MSLLRRVVRVFSVVLSGRSRVSRLTNSVLVGSVFVFNRLFYKQGATASLAEEGRRRFHRTPLQGKCPKPVSLSTVAQENTDKRRSVTICWKSVEERLQSMYDCQNPQSRTTSRLWRVAEKVRADLEIGGMKQACLARGAHALKVEGVIYAISCGKRVYVGQTMRTPLCRFRDHWYEAHGHNEKKPTPLHLHMRRIGIENFSVFPLEVIPPAAYRTKGGKVNKKKFHVAATPREIYWIERLHSFQSGRTGGYNVALVSGRKGRRSRRQNPMMYKRAKARVNQIPVVSSEVVSQQPSSKGIVEDAVADFEHKYDFPASNVRNPLAAVTPTGENAEKQETYGRLFGFRNYLRRCKYLAHRFEIGRLARVHLGCYSNVVLKRMLRFLNYGQIPTSVISSKARLAIMKLLRKFLMTRVAAVARKKNVPSVLILSWSSKLLRFVPIRSIMTKHRDLLPGGAIDCVENVVVAKRLPDPISKLIFNYSSAAKKFTRRAGVEHDPSRCPCRKLFNNGFRPNGACVLTGDLDIVENAELRRLLSYGPRFRLRAVASPMNELKKALEEFVAKQGLMPALYGAWLEAVLTECRKHVKRACAAVLPQEDSTVDMSEAAWKYLKHLQKYLVLVPADKAANNVVFVCKQQYIADLAAEFDHSGAYSLVADGTSDEVIEDHKRVLSVWKVPVSDSLPYLYWLPKLHKVPVGRRFIAGSGFCTTTEVSRILSDVGSLILSTLRRKDDELIGAMEIRRFFVVNGYEEVATFLQSFPRSDTPRESRVLTTGDFSTMYTTIPHADLKSRIEQVLEEAWSFQSDKEGVDKGKLFAHWVSGASGRGRATWCSGEGVHEGHSAFEHTLSLDTIRQFLRFLIDNTYLVNGNEVRRQVVGIPMGTNCAPSLANLYLYSYESEFIDRIKNSHGTEYAKQFHESYRLIDDTLSVNNPHWREWVRKPAEDGGLYPVSLTLNDTTVSDSHVHFLGMDIVDSGRVDGKLSIDVFDKRREFPFAVRRYPHMHSLIPRSIPYGVFTGQLHRFHRICSDWRTFVRNARFVARTLCHQGCSKRVLRLKFHAFIVAHMDRLKVWATNGREVCRAFNKGL